MGKKYKTYKEWEPVEMNWRRKNFRMCCCDCGLVHTMQIAVVGNTLRIRVRRDNRATGQIRRHMREEQDGS